jgi:hypothetical protein
MVGEKKSGFYLAMSVMLRKRAACPIIKLSSEKT